MKLDHTYFVGLGKVSYSAIQRVLSGLPEDIRNECEVDKIPRQLKVAGRAILSELGTKIDLPLIDGTTFTWTIARPQAVLVKFVGISPALQRVVRPIIATKSFANPLKIIHYHDIVTSGNLLAPVKSRSFCVFRFTLNEFGKHLLTRQEMWFEFGILRSSVLYKVIGGVSHVWSRLQHVFFTGVDSFANVGVYFEDLRDCPSLFARNGNLIADMEAAHATFDLKGSSGMKNCVKCSNGLKKNTLIEHGLPNDDGKLVEITAPTLNSFVPNTNENIFACVDELPRMNTLVISKKMFKYEFEYAQMACGMNYNPHGLLLDKPLRPYCAPLDLHTEDWAHVYLCNGVGGDELWHLLKRLNTVGVTYDTFKTELRLWRWPRNISGSGKGVWRLFSSARAEANKECWKSSASEFLMICPIVHDWISRHMSTRLPGEVASFRLLCNVLDYIQALKHGLATDIGKLHALIEEHLEVHNLVYGNEHWTPKWHATLHLADQVERDEGDVYDTIANERYHQVAKGFGDVVKNLSNGTFEEYVLGRSLHHQIHCLREFEERPSMVGKRVWNNHLSAYIAGQLSCKGLHIAIGDYVRTREGEVVEVKLCGQTNGDLFLLGGACEVRSRVATSVDVAGRESLILVWIADNCDVTCARSWKPMPESDVLRVII